MSMVPFKVDTNLGLYFSLFYFLLLVRFSILKNIIDVTYLFATAEINTSYSGPNGVGFLCIEKLLEWRQ